MYSLKENGEKHPKLGIKWWDGYGVPFSVVVVVRRRIGGVGRRKGGSETEADYKA